MLFPTAFAAPALESLFDSILPDLLLAFTFFTALSYSVLGRHFGRQRPAVAMSVALGAALAVGLVWWEQANDLSIRDLGPIAVTLALVVMAVTVYAALRSVGGNWAGIALACGATLLLAALFGLPWPVDNGAVFAFALVALLVGLLVFLTHHTQAPANRTATSTEAVIVRRELHQVSEQRSLAEQLTRQLHDLRVESQWIGDRPELAEDVMVQLGRILPAEGWLTERLAELRAKAHFMREGHVARFEELRDTVAGLSPEARRRLSEALAKRYRELELDARVERLDRAVAELERRVRELTQAARERLAIHNYRAVPQLLEHAERLQEHNVRLLRIIERTEGELLNAVRQVTAQAVEVSDG
jgi:hypothetical protein